MNNIEIEGMLTHSPILFEPDIRVEKRFRVHDERTADWVLQQIARAQDELERITVQYESRKKDLEKRIEWFRKRFGFELEQWARKNLPHNRKTVKLAHGNLRFRTVKPQVEIVDQEKALDWAKQNCPDAVVVRESVLKTPLKETIFETGEIPDGVEVTPAGEKFSIDLNI